MSKRMRILVLLMFAAFVAVGAAIYLSVDDAGATDPRSVVSSDMRDVVADSVGAPTSPLAENAEASMRHLYTPDDPDLPGFFAAPTKSGEECVVTSDAVISSCLQNAMPGTVSVRDDSTGDEIPPFVYGLVRPSVRGVSVTVNGVDHQATLVDGFYLLKLPSPNSRVEAVASVSFRLGYGREFTRPVSS